MAIPSGSGTEVLKRTFIHAQSNTATSFRWDGTMATTGTSTYTVPANHIITVLNISFNEQGNAAEIIDIMVNDGTNNIYLLQYQPLPAYSTFVWNDKIVLTGGDKLIIKTDSAANVDAFCSYIDQDWS
tara:strand:- start:115 stop:498 length:384 start_codon:yes stop_codon:yes gene_type:complete